MTEEKNNINCGPCYREDGPENVAVGYCKDCKEHLCKECFGSHRKPKPCRNHCIVPLNEASNISNNTRERPNDLKDETCSKHFGLKTEVFCVVHNDVICVYCFYKEHSACQNVHLTDIKHDFLYSEEVEKCLKRLQETTDNAELIKLQVDENIQTMEESNKLCEQSIDTFNELLKDAIHKLHNNMKEQVISLSQNNTLSSAIDYYQNAKKNIDATIHTIETCRENGHPCRLFVELKAFESTIKLIQADILNAGLKNNCKTYVFKQCFHLQRIVNDKDLRLGTLEEIKSGSEGYEVQQYTIKW